MGKMRLRLQIVSNAAAAAAEVETEAETDNSQISSSRSPQRTQLYHSSGHEVTQRSDRLKKEVLFQNGIQAPSIKLARLTAVVLPRRRCLSPSAYLPFSERLEEIHVATYNPYRGFLYSLRAKRRHM